MGKPAGGLISAFVAFADVADGHADTDVPSDWSYITCAVRDGSVYAYFSATPETFPSTVPSTASCTSGGYTLVLNLQQVPWPASHDASLVPAAGVTWDLTVPTGTNPTHRYAVYDLPAGPAYLEGSWPAQLTPSVLWDGVECGAGYAPNGSAKLWIRGLSTAAADEGYCVLQSASGVPHAIPLEIIR